MAAVWGPMWPHVTVKGKGTEERSELTAGPAAPPRTWGGPGGSPGSGVSRIPGLRWRLGGPQSRPDDTARSQGARPKDDLIRGETSGVLGKLEPKERKKIKRNRAKPGTATGPSNSAPRRAPQRRGNGGSHRCGFTAGLFAIADAWKRLLSTPKGTNVQRTLVQTREDCPATSRSQKTTRWARTADAGEGRAGPDAASRRHRPQFVSTVTASSVSFGSVLTTQAGASGRHEMQPRSWGDGSVRGGGTHR